MYNYFKNSGKKSTENKIKKSIQYGIQGQVQQTELNNQSILLHKTKFSVIGTQWSK